jgi:DNA-binding transcriptional LysR family regulator
MQDLNDMITFARVVDAKSFSEAARRLGMSKSRVSKSIAKLERSLGAKLLNRSTRSLSLTEVGALFYQHCRRVADEVAAAEEAVGQLHSEPRGVLRLTAPVAFGTLHIAPALPSFLARYPDLAMDVTITDRMIDLVDEGYDVAVRLGRVIDPSLVAVKLAPVRRVVCATPEYFKRRGIPDSPDELANHNCLYYTHVAGPGEWRLKGVDGEITIPVRGDLRINDDEALSQAVLGGLGVALLPTFLIGKELQSGRLQAVLSDYVPLERYIFAVRLQNANPPAKVRAFIDFLRARFGSEPYWDKAETTDPSTVDRTGQPDSRCDRLEAKPISKRKGHAAVDSSGRKHGS